jgi:hypothetical protein
LSGTWAPTRHDRRSRLGRQPHDLADLVDAARPQHQRRRAMPEPAPLNEIRRDVLLVAQRIFVTDDRSETINESGIEFL